MADVVVIGGGLAGLATALKLSQYKKRVILLEKDSSVGGHLFSKNESPIEVFSWYHCVREVMQLLDLPLSTRMKDGLAIVGNHQGRPRTIKYNSFQPRDVVDALRLSVSARRIWNARTLYQLSRVSPLPYANDVSIERLYESMVGEGNPRLLLLNSFLEGVAYPAAKENSAHFTLGLKFRDSSTTTTLCGGTAFTKKLVDYLGRTVDTRTGVTDIVVSRTGDAITVSFRDSAGLQQHLSVRDIVFACPISETLKLKPDIYKLMVSPPKYAKVYAVTITYPDDPDDLHEWLPGYLNWSVVSIHRKLRVISSNGLRLLSIGKGCGNRKGLVLYIEDGVAGADEVARITAGVQEIIRHKLLYPLWNSKIVKVKSFSHATPYPDLQLVENVRRGTLAQSGIHFAGQYLGLPCLETACYTGFRAAHEIIGKQSLADFDKKMRSIDRQYALETIKDTLALQKWAQA